jgi:hypothetical protein
MIIINNNLKFLLVLVYICITVYITYYVSNQPIISFFNNNFKNYDLVLSRFNEDIDWIKKDPFNQFNIICYNKGPNEPLDDCLPGNCKIINLENVGKCDHTYLYHIINNYDNLSQITLFIPASTYSIPWKYDILMKNMELLNSNNSSIFYGCKFDDVVTELYDFTLDNYIVSGDAKNKEINGSHTQLKISPIRPYGKWFEQNIGTEVKIKSTVICFYGIFIVDKEHIRQRPKEFYENLIKYVDDDVNPEVGHYLERSWPAIFLPYPESCKFYNETC